MSHKRDERVEMVNDFVAESREMLDDIEPQIMELEKCAQNSGAVSDEVLNTVFRLFHSIKGMASFLDLQTVMTVTHETETLLELLRKGRLTLTNEHINLLYHTSDFLRRIIDTVKDQLDDGGFEGTAQTIIEQIRQTISDPAPGAAIPESQTAGLLAEPLAEEPEGLQLIITPEMVKRFVDEALETFEEAESGLLQLEARPHDSEIIEHVFRCFHSFKGNAGFFGYADFERISHLAESILDDCRDKKRPVTAAMTSALLAMLDGLRQGLALLGQTGRDTVPNRDELILLLKNQAAIVGPAETTYGSSAAPDLAGSPLVTAVPAEPIGRIGAAEAVDESAGTGAADGDELLPTVPAREELLLNPTDDYWQQSSGSGAGEQGEHKDDNGRKSAGGQQAIRVDVEKLNALLDLVGELVVAQVMVLQNPDLAGLQLDRFEKAALHLAKIIRDVQDVAMSMRMIPLAGVFRKMVRLVRDVSLKRNKKVTLEIIGEETEVDKTIIEQISDPLVHILRNAVDHGIESPPDRLAAGKPPVGQVVLEAKHAAGEVWIIVRDDGKGLNREKILGKARERGLVAGDGRELKDEEVWNLIFEPGLSTADAVTSISGRGVGMDVVKRNIEKLKGRIDVRSVPGQGTIFAIRIPLTLAIIDGMIVRVGKTRYTIPITSIRQSFQPRADQITVTPDGLEVVNIRGELLPVVRLHSVYNIQPKVYALPAGILIIVETDTQKCCLFVDEVIGQQQIVIKGMPEYFGHVAGASGFAIMGDGEVSMILDIVGLVQSLGELEKQ